MRRSAAGFTLIEVLIALVILATALTLGLGSVQRSARTLGTLQERLLAHWAAQNAVVEQLLAAAARSSTDPAEPVQRRTTVTQYGASFVVATRLQPGTRSEPGSLRVEVAPENAPQSVVASIDTPVPSRP